MDSHSFFSFCSKLKLTIISGNIGNLKARNHCTFSAIFLCTFYSPLRCQPLSLYLSLSLSLCIITTPCTHYMKVFISPTWNRIGIVINIFVNSKEKTGTDLSAPFFPGACLVLPVPSHCAKREPDFHPITIAIALKERFTERRTKKRECLKKKMKERVGSPIGSRAMDDMTRRAKAHPTKKMDGWTDEPIGKVVWGCGSSILVPD